MTTSRTGTAEYLRNRDILIRRAHADGVKLCPGCGRELDYLRPGKPNSVEADHIIPAVAGGSDRLENLRIRCRTCNRTRGAKMPTQIKPVVTKRKW